MKLKYLLPSLMVAPIVAIATIVPTTSCKKSESEDKKPKATRIEFVDIVDGQEIDVATNTSFNLKTKVYPEEADQEVSYKIVKQDGQGNLACSKSGEFHTNNSVGTCVIKAVSKDGECASDLITLRFYDSRQFDFFKSGEQNLLMINSEHSDVEYSIIPSMHNGEYITATALGAFYRCNKLKYVLFPNNEHFDSISGYSFFGCSNLTEIDVPNNVKYVMDYAFRNCSSLTKVSLGESVKYIGACAFYACDSLESIVLPEALQIINDQAFDYCSSLEVLNIPKNVTHIGNGAFSNCWKCQITLDPDNQNFVYIKDSEDHDGLYAKDMTRFICADQLSECKKFNMPSTVKTIDNAAFMFMEKIEEITLPDTLDNIGANAFAFCYNLKNINIPTSLTIIRECAFFFCANLSEITIPANVETIEDRAFYWCNQMQSLKFADTSKTWKVINNVTGLNVPTYSTTDPSLNAVKLTTWGYKGSTEWIGGYSIANWTKNI